MTTRQQKLFAELTIETYLDSIQELTGNYLDTLALLEMEPKDILLAREEKIRNYLSVIKVCLDTILLKKMEVTYTGEGFNVKLTTY
ncbi:MAG: hypothetical protein LLF80_06145 [Porphyromonadaceae bacterium]|nr:hypothetical protein [Porphyromonadaceae bacterium]